MPPKSLAAWSPIGNVTLRRQYIVERNADVYRLRSSTLHGAEFVQLVDGPVVRYLAKVLQGQTVIVEDAEKALRKSGLKLPYQYGYRLKFLGQYVLTILVASGQASHRKAGHRFEYDIA
jgi:hypothetical protein